MKIGDGCQRTPRWFFGTRASAMLAAAIVIQGCGSQGSNTNAQSPDAPAGGTDGGNNANADVLEASSTQPPIARGGTDASTPITDAAPSSMEAATDGRTEAGAVASDGAIDPCGPSNTATVALPVIGSSTFDVRAYGAVGDGVTDDTTALQAALAAAGSAGGGTVVVPAGTFLSGPIVVSSGTDLELSSGAELEMLPMSRYPGTTAFITANDAHDIALTGVGTIEGQGQAWWDALADAGTLTRPQEVSFSNSTRVLVSGIRLQNPPEEHIWVKGDTDVTVTGITISTLAVPGQPPPANTDGVDISANGVFFCNNNIACGDDNVVMEGTSIYVAYSSFGVGHGCSIGSITQNGVSGVTVDHVSFDGTTSGVRMKSERGRGGLVQNLSYSNLTMTNVENPVFITSYYPTLPTDPTTDTAQAVTATTPEWEDITLSNITATGSTNAGILWGLPEAKISNVTFDNVRISAKTGMEIFHATGISFTNGSTVTAASGAAVTVYDATVSGVTTTPFP